MQLQLVWAGHHPGPGGEEDYTSPISIAFICTLLRCVLFPPPFPITFVGSEQYLKDLEPACGTGDSSYEDRKKARADETDALRKAQTILEEAFRAKAFLQK